MIYELISKVLINVLLIFIFIAIFFFTYGAHLEENVIANQMNILAINFTDTFKLSGNKINTDLNKFINTNILSPDNIKNISAGDGKALAGNNKIINMVVLYIIIFLTFVTVVIIALKLTKNIDIKHILIESIIVLFFIAITYYSFITFYGAKFISVNTNAPKLEIITELHNYSKSLRTGESSNTTHH